MKNDMRTLPKRIRKRKHPPVPSILTDHALLRFLERTGVINVRQFRNTLLTNKLKAVCKESAEQKSTVRYFENGLSFTIVDGRVVTVLPIDMLR